MPVTEILFGDQDGLRVGDSANDGGPVASIQVAPPGDDVTEITTVETPPTEYYELTAVILFDTPGILTLKGYSNTLGSIPDGGSITPPSLNGANIRGLYTGEGVAASNPGFVVAITGNLSQDFFTSITVNGTTLLSADADDFAVVGDYTGWHWPVFPFTDAGIYEVSFT